MTDKKKQAAAPGPEIDGFYVRETYLKPPAGAPFEAVRLVVRRATNALNLRIDQAASRLLVHMKKSGRDVEQPALRRYVTNFCACAAQTEVAEGLPGFADWEAVKLGMDSARRGFCGMAGERRGAGRSGRGGARRLE